MRTREKIANDSELKEVKTIPGINAVYSKCILEVLLDIRDLISKNN